MTPATAILVPVLNRPQLVQRVVESIESATPEPHRILFVVSAGDTAELDAVQDFYREHGDLRIGQEYGPVFDYLVVQEPGTWACKINAGFRATEEPFVFLAADDLKFHHGWLAEALGIMDAPRGRFGVVGTNDLGNQRTFDHSVPGYPHATHSLVRRAYIDGQGGTMDKGPGVVLCEEYPHEYADDELVETAKTRGVYAHADTSVVEHLHPNYGKARDDDTYAYGRSRTKDARRIFNERAQRLGFAEPRGRLSSRDAGELGRRAAQLDHKPRLGDKG